MNSDRLDVKELTPIDVCITKNVAIYRQLGMWQDLTKTYTFVPTTSQGYVIITGPNAPIECEPLQGYTLQRPSGLELSWHIDRIVVFREISMVAATECSFNAHNVSWTLISGTYYD